MESDNRMRRMYEQATLGKISMVLLQIMQGEDHPKFEEYQAEATDPNADTPTDGYRETDRKLLLKAYKEIPEVALKAFLEVPEVVEILGIKLDDDLPPL